MAIVLIVIGLLVGRFMVASTEAGVTSTLQSISEQSTSAVNVLFKYASNYVQQLSYNEEIIGYLNDVKTRGQIKSHPLYLEVYNSLAAIGQSDDNVFGLASQWAGEFLFRQ